MAPAGLPRGSRVRSFGGTVALALFCLACPDASLDTSSNALFGAAMAQDIRGLEICTAEKQMDRRTGCLQANTEFLQRRLDQLTLEMRQKQEAASARIAAAGAQIAALQDALSKLQTQIDDWRKTKAEQK